MANIAFTCPSKIWEQTVEKRENKVHSLKRSARSLRLWRRARTVIAEWDSQARQRESLARLDDRLLGDIGLAREKRIVEVSKLFYWLP